MFKVAVGHSEDPDSLDAVEEVLAQCRITLGEIVPQVCVVFSSVDYDYSIILKKIRETYPNVQIVGCTSSSELSSKLGYAEGTLLLIAYASDTIAMATGVVRHMSQNISENVANTVAEIKNQLKKDPAFCIIFPDIFTIGTVRLVEELKQALGADFPILGGGASDPWKFNLSREFYNEEVLQDSAPILFFAGPIECSFSVVSGWEPFTSRKMVMECNKNVVSKIDHGTALDFYKHYLGGLPSLAHPLAIFEENQEKFYLRAPLDVNETTGSIVLGGDLPLHATISICQAEPKKLIGETEKLMQEVMPKKTEQQPACVMVFSCCCRQKILGTRTKEEYQIMSHEIGPDIPVFGFYAYGQVSPFEKNQPSFVHNESVVAIVLKEKHE